LPNYLEYRKSISKELISIKDRVRNFIDDRHWGEDGRYKEIIFSEVLKNVLPQNVTVATGFIMGDRNQLSTQIDIIIYKKEYPVLFKIADFVVVLKESVIGIIEVKSNIGSTNIGTTIEKSHKNGILIGGNIFNGVFGYETEFKFDGANSLSRCIGDAFQNNCGYLNHICFGKDYFMKYWKAGNPSVNDRVKCYSFYKIDDLSFGYFVSNLIELIYTQTNNRKISRIMRSSLFPIENTKEAHRLERLELRIPIEEVQ
jgi:hypothetical protein